MFCPKKPLIRSTYFITPNVFDEYNANAVKLRGGKSFKNFNNWSLLYVKQKGLCDICGTSLGYLSPDNLEIHHLKKVVDLDVNDPLLKDVNNLKLVHKSCHKGTLKFDKE